MQFGFWNVVTEENQYLDSLKKTGQTKFFNSKKVHSEIRETKLGIPPCN
jgi:hypothetical protein